MNGYGASQVRHTSFPNASAELDVRLEHRDGCAEMISGGRVQLTGQGHSGQAPKSRQEQHKQVSPPLHAPVGWQQEGGVVIQASGELLTRFALAVG
jgi:hypothetical protein